MQVDSHTEDDLITTSVLASNSSPQQSSATSRSASDTSAGSGTSTSESQSPTTTFHTDPILSGSGAGGSQPYHHVYTLVGVVAIVLPAAFLQFVDNHEYVGTVASENVTIVVNPANSQGPSDSSGSQGSSAVATATATQTVVTSYKTTGSDTGTGNEAVVGYRFTFVYMLLVLYAIARITRGRDGGL